MTVDPQALLDDVGPASLVEMGTLVADLGERHILQGTPLGTRVIVDVIGVRIEGPRMPAPLQGSAAADWVTRRGRRHRPLDVRATIKTHDGALIFIQYSGRVRFSTPTRPTMSSPARASRPATRATPG